MQQALAWLTTHSCYPTGRLPADAELLVLFAAAAAEEEVGPRIGQNTKVVRNQNYNAEMRNYTAMRRRAHINSDNSAKT